MILQCPNCETCYETSAEIPDGGRKVRCAECGEVWTAKQDDEVDTPQESELQDEPLDQAALDEMFEAEEESPDEEIIDEPGRRY